MKILLALAVAASAAPWVVSYKRTTKERDVLSLEAQDGGKVRLCIEAQCSILTAYEALELSRIIATVLVPPDADKSFDELAEESSRKTDAEFCARAKTDWERRAFCAKEGK